MNRSYFLMLLALSILAVDDWNMRHVAKHMKQIAVDASEIGTLRGKQIDYLIHLLNQHNVSVSEFDLIALNNPVAGDE